MVKITCSKTLLKRFLFINFKFIFAILKTDLNLKKGFDCCSESSISFHYINENATDKLSKIFRENRNIKSNTHQVIRKILDLS